jgi:large subunit ribosomal protein L35
MPKQKTHKGAAKRFNLTKSGKVKRAQAFKRHILTKKSTKRKRNLRHSGILSKAEQARAKVLMPYS